MSTKTIVWICVFLGSSIGGLIPALWGDSFFSLSSLFLSTLGGLVGIWVGIQFGNSMNG